MEQRADRTGEADRAGGTLTNGVVPGILRPELPRFFRCLYQ
jgi:hypothetical protein